MSDFVFSLLWFVLAISVLTAAHEYGHYWVARRLGFKVLRFSIGFGKRLLVWHGRDPDAVEYCISALPLGGYVKMLDEREEPVTDAERHRAFNRRPIAQRIAVLLAGPAFNFLLAIVLYWLVFMSGVPGVRPVVENVTPGSLAAEAGLEPGEFIAAVGGRETATVEDAVIAVFDELLADGEIELDVRRQDGAERRIVLDARDRTQELTQPDGLFPGLGFSLGLGALVPADIARVDPESPAAEAGLRAGDRILAADGEAIDGWQRWVAFVRARPGETIVARIRREDREVEVAIAIGTVVEDGAAVGRIGTWPAGRLPEELVAQLRTEQRYGPFAALPHSVAKTWEMTALTVRLVGHMLVGDVSLRSASGPIMIAAYAGESAAAGATAFLSFLAIVSVSLGIMNLLPVPILDGGQVLYQIAEWLKGAPLSERAMALGQQIGLAILIVLMSVVFYNDLTQIFAT